MADYIHNFNRFELKYLLHYKQVEEFLTRISSHVDVDANAQVDNSYKIVSRYYDSQSLTCYWEKVDGEKYRRKVRIRTYGDRPEDAFVEVKQRLNLTVQKRRCRVPVDVAEAEFAKMDRGQALSPDVDPVFNEVYNLHRRYQLEPKMIISYNRQAFFDRYRSDLRITLDRNIRARHLDLSLTEHRTRGRWAVPPTQLVLEVKFDQTVPRWICSVLNGMNLQVSRLSKYCCGIESFGMQAGGKASTAF